MVIEFTGKRAFITGGSRGIGAATVKLFAGAGARVAFTYRSHRAEADAVVKAAGGSAQCFAIQADLSDPKAGATSVEEAAKRLGGLDYFVANAGVWPPDDEPVRDMDPERWRKTMAVNLDAVFYGCRAALPLIAPGGAIVIVTSTAGQRGEAYHADYAATKGALISFVKSIAIEAAPGITVNSVAPGWVDTEMSAVPYDRDRGAGRQEIAASIPLQRIATAEDIAGPIAFLCSPLARHITGEILNVNGGAVLCG